MALVCSICKHKKRAQIEAAIAEGESLRTIADRYATSKTTLIRHKENCIKPAIQLVQTAQVIKTGVSSLERLDRAAELVDGLVWQEHQDPDLLIKALAELRRQVELRAKLTGELDQHPQVNIQQTPDWHEMRAAFLDALADLPEAKGRILRLMGA